MPKILGVKERLYKELWSAWIADTRPDGLGISKDMHYAPKMRFFTGDIGDRFRTNLICYPGGQLFPTHTASIHKFGIFVSFTNPFHYKEFFQSTSFKFYIDENKQIEFPTLSMNKPLSWLMNKKAIPYKSFPHGSMSWHKLTKPIKIKEKQSFYGILTSESSFIKEMREIETGHIQNAYAQIKIVLGTDYIRDVV
jgi:hypothetical protein